MHVHYSSKAAQACSRFCAANFADRAYWERHNHVRDDAPVKRCGECEHDAKRAEEARYHANA